ncbi:hypothetical protein [Maritalea myrionectae]|uniref:hypothetical protein n=1 Tax=Maritalea myrionectae TaxID=454601 RepID=UPI0004882650|nr:hypothetical protein [Maritalea myrionectae]
MKPAPKDPRKRIELWEWALDQLALRIDQMGDAGLVYLPLYERLEQELEADLTNAETINSIKRRLANREKATQSL